MNLLDKFHHIASLVPTIIRKVVNKVGEYKEIGRRCFCMPPDLGYVKLLISAII